MIFNHRETKKPALWITPYDPSWKNQDDPNLYHIKEWQDLPEPTFYEKLQVPIEIWKGQGNVGLYYYFQAFLKEVSEFTDDFWFFLLPSGFPGGVIAIQSNK